MPMHVDATASCFTCKIAVTDQLQVVPPSPRRPALPKGFAFFEPREGNSHDPIEEVFCPKHHPQKGWRKIEDIDAASD